MTAAQALRIVKEKFGEKATVEIDMPHFYPRMRHVHPTGEWSTFTSGTGKKWESAIAQAEYKENKRLGVW